MDRHFMILDFSVLRIRFSISELVGSESYTTKYMQNHHYLNIICYIVMPYLILKTT